MTDNAGESSVTTGKTHKSFFSKHGLRQVVSQKRVRFQDGEFDLDLSYICPNVLAMGLPANGMDAMFRNNEQDVSNMLNKFHPNSYMIYNLAQKKYDYSLFDNRVQDLGWKDHHAPGLELLFANVNSMCEFLKQDFKNVVIVHCKAGKGRTGTSIAALLVYCGLYRTPEEALKYFSYRRANTIDPKGGVTIPSQKRYIKYFADILSGAQQPNRNKYKINSISISGVPMYDKNKGAKLVVHVMHDTIHELYNGKKEPIKLEPVTHTQGTFHAQGLQEVELDGDIMLKFANVGFFNEEVKFRISFNTHMIEGDEIYWIFYRHDLDDAYKDDEVPSQFKLEIRMTKCGESPGLPVGVYTEWQKALKNRHLYQNMFSKMSYQASTVYDPANSIGDTMDDIPNFLSEPQQIINGVIIENKNSSSAFASMETWEQQQEEKFLQEQAMRNSLNIIQPRSSGTNQPISNNASTMHSNNNNINNNNINNNNTNTTTNNTASLPQQSNNNGMMVNPTPTNPTSGQFNAFTPNPISPRMSSGFQSFSMPLPTTAPPALPRRPKPSLQQWEAYFQQHQQSSMGPATILGVMLQLPQYPLTTSTPSINPPLSPQHQQMQTSPSFSNNNNNPNAIASFPSSQSFTQTNQNSAYNNPMFQQQSLQQQPSTPQILAPTYRQDSGLPAPPPPPSTPNPHTQSSQQNQPFQQNPMMIQTSTTTPTTTTNTTTGTEPTLLPPPPAPPTPNTAAQQQNMFSQQQQQQQTQQAGTSYNYYSGQQNAYSQQYQQLQSIGGNNNAPPPVLPRRPPMAPPTGGQPQ